MEEHRLSPAGHLAWLKENYATVLAVPLNQLSLPVADCPGWRVETIVAHLARAAFAFGAYMRSPVDRDPMPEILAGLPDESSGRAAIDLAQACFVELLATVDNVEMDRPCPFVTGPGTVATWLWHGACETWIHRADVEHTIGGVPVLDAPRGMDCLRWSVWIRQLVASRRPHRLPAVRCVATDASDSVVVGPPPPQRELIGRAADLSLRLWNRRHGPLEGDCAEVEAWANLEIRSPLC
jgi:uncharacterized protein (TIGR03083 family)